MLELLSSKSKKILGGAFLLFVFFAVSHSAFAFEISYPTLPGGISLSQGAKLNEFVRYIYAFSIFISGFVALGILLFGGVLYLLALDNPAKKALAREWMAAGFWGTLILLLSYIILATINPQLVGLEEVTFEPIAVPSYEFTAKTPLAEQKDIAFQIPMGKLIERVILEARERFSVDGEVFQNDAEFRQAIKTNIQQTIDLIEQLNPDLLTLKSLIKSCKCGGSVCGDACSPKGCNVNCDFSAISDRANKILNSPVLSTLEKNEEKLDAYRYEIKKRNDSLSKAVFLTTIFFDQILDYFSFAIQREAVAKIPERKIEIETLPEWQNINISIKTADGKVIPDPATFYFWKRYKEMQDAIDFAATSIGEEFGMACPGISAPGTSAPEPSVPPNTICTSGKPGTMIWPAKGRITTPYGVISPATGQVHYGIDIANRLGTPIWAAASGKVIDAVGWCRPGDKDCANKIIIEHRNFDPDIGTVYTLYGHLDTVWVSRGDTVKQGQQIGTMGKTGFATGVHLHFGVAKSKRLTGFMDPMIYLTGETSCKP